MQYRREIDGLRTLAVVPVILFHAGIQGFTGGFVGVDIFFVISGYLITSIILAEKQAETFTLLNFYERRARRILPALFLVILVCLPFAWMWMMPAYMKSFSDSLVAVCAFASNFLFWKTSGYFETSAELKPLLHTWSLAVEEQYYVLFPLLLIFAWKFGKRRIVLFLALLAIASLIAAQWLSVTQPSASFFLLPTRGWELLIGAFVAFYFFNDDRTTPSDRVGQWASAAGLGLIVFAIVVYDKNTTFPSLYTLVPTVGAALIILYATEKTWVGKLLGNRVFVGIGLISYSAYLWHQPLFAFARHRNLGEPSKLLLIGLGIAALVLAYGSWRFVEVPFRNKQRFSRNQIFTYGAAGSALLVAVGLFGHFTRGFENRLSDERREFLSYFENNKSTWKYFAREQIPQRYRFDCGFFDVQRYRGGNPTKKPNGELTPDCYVRDNKYSNAVLVWGDSHAQQLYFGLSRNLPKNWQLLQVASTGCEPKLNASESQEDYCEHSNWFAHKTIAQARPDVVIVAQNTNQNVATMSEFVNSLKLAGVKRVIFTGPTPHWKFDLPDLIVNKLWADIPRRTFVGLDTDIARNDERLKAGFPSSDSARLVSIVDYFCNEQGCLLYDGDDLKTGITTWDYGHLSPVASNAFARDVLARNIVDGL